eukprot:3172777-Pyramimonas_sp.AAC.1
MALARAEVVLAARSDVAEAEDPCEYAPILPLCTAPAMVEPCPCYLQSLRGASSRGSRPPIASARSKGNGSKN